VGGEVGGGWGGGLFGVGGGGGVLPFGSEHMEGEGR